MYVKSLVKPEITVEFKTDKAKWFPLKDTPKHEAYDKRTPGLFKVEWGKGGGGSKRLLRCAPKPLMFWRQRQVLL